MTATTETSIMMQEVEPELSGPSGMSIALIGPNDTHRKIVAKALTGAEATKVREFVEYPGRFTDLPCAIGQGYDVVLIDVDSDESYALVLIEHIAAVGRARVVAYSKRDNPELVASCVQAGAQDLLPLPAEDDEEFLQISPPVVEEVRQDEPADLPAPEIQGATEERSEPEESIEKKRTEVKAVETLSPPRRDNGRKPEPVSFDFTDWDARFLRPTRPEVVVAPEPKPQAIFARKRSRKYSLRITPIESYPPVDEEEGVPAAAESNPADVEDNPPEVESRLPEVESLTSPDVDVNESVPATVENLPTVVESNPPEVESRLPEVESLTPADVDVDESVPATVESTPAAVESNPPDVESRLPEVESLTPVDAEERRSDTVDSSPAVVDNAPLSVISFLLEDDDDPTADAGRQPAVENRPAVAEYIPLSVKSHLPDDDSDPTVDVGRQPAVENRPAVADYIPLRVKSRLPDDDGDPTVDVGRQLAVESRPAVAEYIPLRVRNRMLEDRSDPTVKADHTVVDVSRPADFRTAPHSVQSRLPDDDGDPTVDVGPPAKIARTSSASKWMADDPVQTSGDEFTPFEKRKRLPMNTSEACAIEDADDDDEKPRGAWMKAVLITAGFGLVAGMLVIVSGHPVRKILQSTFPAENVAYQTESPDPAPAVRRSTPRSWRRILDTSREKADGQEAAEPVSSDLMVAQLTAPPRIPVDAKRPAPTEEPPAGLAPGAMDGGASVPSAVFGGEGKVQVVPGVSAISAGVASGLLMHRTAPVYPAFARDNHMSGTVLLAATITKTGTITALHVLSGPSVFRSAAADAVKTWRYKPYMLDNQPVDVQTTISVVFRAGGH